MVRNTSITTPTKQLHNQLHLGVYLSLRGILYANNSVISITEIGETDTSISPPQNSNNGLQCITDRMPCCRSAINRAGHWFYPNGTWVEGYYVIVFYNNVAAMYRNRGQDDGTVNLNRVNSTVIPPTGLYCCVVPDATSIEQILCANLGKLIG